MMQFLYNNQTVTMLQAFIIHRLLNSSGKFFPQNICDPQKHDADNSYDKYLIKT